MIQANELRIKNYLNPKVKGIILKDEIHIVEPTTLMMIQGVIDNKGIEFEPIPLTEEILLKCGFEFDIFYQKLTNGTMCIYWCDKICLLSWCKSHRDDILRHEYPKYLHQLQNLYFALTNEELQIEL